MIHIVTVNLLTPIIASVVREGIADGEFETPFPDEAVAILLKTPHERSYGSAWSHSSITDR